MHPANKARWILLPAALALAVGTTYSGHVHAKDKHGRVTVTSISLSSAEAQRASTLFAQTCAACHGARLEGGVGPSLVGVGSRYALAKIERIAQHGKGKKKSVPMPAGLATPEEASLLARWLISGPIFGTDSPQSSKP